MPLLNMPLKFGRTEKCLCDYVSIITVPCFNEKKRAIMANFKKPRCSTA